MNTRSIILTVSLLLTLSASISAAPGELDPTFGNGGIAGVGRWGYQLYFSAAMAMQRTARLSS